MNGVVYIYGLKCPVSNVIRYVGKAVNLERRLKAHLSGKSNVLVREWIKDLSSVGKKPVMEVLVESTEETWEADERSWIKFFQSKDLLNSHPGGNIFDGTKVKLVRGVKKDKVTIPVSNSKSVVIWTAKALNGSCETESRVTLRALCGVLGISFKEAKKRQNMTGNKTIWVVDHRVAWEVWAEWIDR